MTAASPSTSSITSQADRIAPAICSPGPNHQSLFPNSCPYGRLRARTPSGGSGPRTAAALRTLPREQLRPCAPCPANSCGSGLGSANPRRPQGLRPLWAVGPAALPCAGAAPPQRPPPKPSLTHRTPSSQQCVSSKLAAANQYHARPPCALSPSTRRGTPCGCPSPRERCRHPPVGAPLVGARPPVYAVVIHS